MQGCLKRGRRDGQVDELVTPYQPTHNFLTCSQDPSNEEDSQENVGWLEKSSDINQQTQTQAVHVGDQLALQGPGHNVDAACT